MTVFVTLDIFQGVIGNVKVFLTPESAKLMEDKWLEENRIKDKSDRELKEKSGIEFHVMECDLKP